MRLATSRLARWAPSQHELKGKRCICGCRAGWTHSLDAGGSAPHATGIPVLRPRASGHGATRGSTRPVSSPVSDVTFAQPVSKRSTSMSKSLRWPVDNSRSWFTQLHSYQLKSCTSNGALPAHEPLILPCNPNSEDTFMLDSPCLFRVRHRVGYSRPRRRASEYGTAHPTHPPSNEESRAIKPFNIHANQ
jgi:hypothetical protein